MPGVDPLVAIDAPQFVNPFHAADQQPLEVQFQRDPQIEVDVQGVVVRDEGAGGRPAGNRVQRGPLDLDESLAPQRGADRLHDPGAAEKPLPHAFAVNQVEVAHPLPQPRIGQPLVLLRRRLQRLAEKVQVTDENGQLAGLRAGQLAVAADEVAQVEALRQGPILLAHLCWPTIN